MSELRKYGFQITWEGDKAQQGVLKFDAAVRNLADAQELLAKEMGDGAKVDATVIKNQKELTRQAKLLLREQGRQERAVKRVTHEYRSLSQQAGRTGAKLDQLKAIHKLGANATLSQKKEIILLVKEQQRLAASSKGAMGSMRNMRGVSQNLGWQLQDTAVQMQMGTDSLVILSQQGSQMASAFGPTGALVGAFIAVAGALAGVIFKSLALGKEYDKLKEKTAELTLEQVKLADESTRLLAIEIKRDELAKSGEKRKDYDNQIESIQRLVKAQKQAIEDADLYTNNETDARKLREKAQGQIEAGEERILKLRRLRNQETQTNLTVEEQLAAILGGKTRTETDRRVETEKYIKSLKEQNVTYGKSEQELRRMALAEQDLTDEQRDRAKNELILLETREDLVAEAKAEQEAYKEAQKAAAAAAKEAEKNAAAAARAAAKKAREDEARKRKAAREVKAEAAAEARMAKAIQDEKDRQEEQAFREKEAARRNLQRVTAGISGTLGGEALLHKQNMEALEEARKQELLIEEEYNLIIEKEAQRHKIAMAQIGIAVLGDAVGQMSSLVDLMTNGVQQVRDQTAEMNGFQKAMFLLQQSVAAASALVNGISLGMKLAEMFVNPALIPVGTALGVANASAIMATTFAGAFDKGGYIPSGQRGIVSEYGDELVNGVMVKGPARVTSREDTAKMTGGGGVTIINNAPGVIHREAGVTDDGKIRIIAEQVFAENIDKGVSTVMSNTSSKARKTMNKQFQTQRNL
tara:strand:- start:7208 stop:9466 length:2259 start_codon:yes stop_codon:yes gene_type:complete